MLISIINILRVKFIKHFLPKKRFRITDSQIDKGSSVFKVAPQLKNISLEPNVRLRSNQTVNSSLSISQELSQQGLVLYLYITILSLYCPIPPYHHTFTYQPITMLSYTSLSLYCHIPDYHFTVTYQPVTYCHISAVTGGILTVYTCPHCHTHKKIVLATS